MHMNHTVKENVTSTRYVSRTCITPPPPFCIAKLPDIVPFKLLKRCARNSVQGSRIHTHHTRHEYIYRERETCMQRRHLSLILSERQRHGQKRIVRKNGRSGRGAGATTYTGRGCERAKTELDECVRAEVRTVALVYLKQSPAAILGCCPTTPIPLTSCLRPSSSSIVHLRLSTVTLSSFSLSFDIQTSYAKQ